MRILGNEKYIWKYAFFKLLYQVFFSECHTRYNILQFVSSVYVYRVGPLNTWYIITICSKSICVWSVSANTWYSNLLSVFLYRVSPLNTQYMKILM
jgi:hypothetical protein